MKERTLKTSVSPSLGRSIDPEVVLWADRTLGLPVHDNWWQTETGGIMIVNYPGVRGAASELGAGSGCGKLGVRVNAL